MSSAANDEQRRFVADASHELRTPVTALHGHARIAARAAQRGDLDQVRESAAIVATESERLTRTLAELLSLADAEHTDPATEPVRLDQIVAEACDEMRAVHNGRRIETQAGTRLSQVTPGGLAELARILIDNALKYSPRDRPVTVTVTSEAGHPTLSVRDHGQGLSHSRIAIGRSTALPWSGVARNRGERPRPRDRKHDRRTPSCNSRLDPHPDGGTVALVEF